MSRHCEAVPGSGQRVSQLRRVQSSIILRKHIVNGTTRDRGLPTILHFSSEDQMTKWQICQTFADIMGLPLDNMIPFKPEEEPKDGTIRPYDCHLDTSELQKLGVDVSTVKFKTWW